MSQIRISRPRLAITRYLAELHGKQIRLLGLRPLSGKAETGAIKGFGYGVPYLIRYRIGSKTHEAVLETMKENQFGHEYVADRAASLVLAHDCFSKLPKHARSIDVGMFAKDGSLKSLGNFSEFFILMEKVNGQEYWNDLNRIAKSWRLERLDLKRAKVLAYYLAEIHKVKRNDSVLYRRRIRDLIGHGECIMGLTDSYPQVTFTSPSELAQIEKKCIDWRWKLKGFSNRLSQVHGDFHPWNVMFRAGVDFTVLDRSRGEWGEPVDDVSAMAINYIFFSLKEKGEFSGPFTDLFNAFVNQYLEVTKEKDLFKVIQPFFAWRALVLASPIWYPSLEQKVRRQIFRFIHSVLDTEIFEPAKVNEYLN